MVVVEVIASVFFFGAVHLGKHLTNEVEQVEIPQDLPLIKKKGSTVGRSEKLHPGEESKELLPD